MTRTLFERSGDTPLCWASVTFRGGSACDPVGAEGLAHHAFELARRGAGSRPRAEIDEALDALGASLHVGIGRDSVAVSTMCLSRHQAAVWSLLGDVVAAPSMAQDEHDKLRRETLRDLDDLRDDDSALASRFFARHARPGTVYSRTAIGTETTLAAIAATGARAEVERTFTRGGAIIGFAGDVEVGACTELARQLRARLPDQPERVQPQPARPGALPGRRLVIVDKPERTQSQILIGHIAPRWGSDESVALLPVETAFGGMFTSRLMQTIRVDHGWSYGAGCRLVRSRGPHWFRISLAPAAEVTIDALCCTLDMYSELCSTGITEDELSFAIDYLVGAMPFGRATPRQRLRRALRDLVCGLPEGFDAGLETRLRDLTLADTRRAIDAGLTAEDLCVVVVCTADKLRSKLEALPWASVSIEDYASY